MATKEYGNIIRIAGPLIVAEDLPNARLNDIVHIGERALTGEIIRIDRNQAYIQVFEDTASLRLYEEVRSTYRGLSVRLGPGLLNMIYDGIQRPLIPMIEQSGDFIAPGLRFSSLDEEKKWDFEAIRSPGDSVCGGDVLGTVMEKAGKPHSILVPPDVAGKIRDISSGSFTVTEPVAVLEDGRTLEMSHYWPVKRPRPIGRKLHPDSPFITGQRVIDSLFPLSLGGTAILPGGFGSGKTVVEQTLAKYSNADIIVYIGCGERGNEMADVLHEFPTLKDPYSDSPLMERTVLIANTSNMPVAAREASIYTGITIAEYYRDMGYNVAVLADSTSRWAEAMREISSRLEEMPGEEGYPTYLSSRLADFYERSGKIVSIGSSGTDRVGTVTIVGAVSPPGGDFSEPVTQNSQRVTGALWELDASLAYRRHYPAINWHRSYSLYGSHLRRWFSENISTEWHEVIGRINDILRQEAALQEIVQLVGPDGLQEEQRIILETGKAIKQDFLQQNAFSEIDAFCGLKKQLFILKAILLFHTRSMDAVAEKVYMRDILELDAREILSRLKETADEEMEERFSLFSDTLAKGMDTLIRRRQS